MIRLDASHDALRSVVEENRADAVHAAKFEVMSIAKEGFVLPDRVAFVVENSPATAHPAGIEINSAVLDRAGLRPDLFLDLASEPIRVGKTHLDLCLFPGCE